MVPPAGSDHLYEVFRAQLDEQLTRAESLDRKLGVAIAALTAVTAGIYAARVPRIAAALLSAWLLVALAQAIRGFAYHDLFAGGPDRAFLHERERFEPEVIRWHTSVVMEESLALNEPKLARQGRILNQVIATLGLVAGVALLGRVLGVSG
jgi:hypothetical protein